jgi:hypothetical protein
MNPKAKRYVGIRFPSKVEPVRVLELLLVAVGRDCVGAIAFRAGTFWKTCATKTKTLRYSPITTFTA